jgi:hypothetical protein
MTTFIGVWFFRKRRQFEQIGARVQVIDSNIEPRPPKAEAGAESDGSEAAMHAN